MRFESECFENLLIGYLESGLGLEYFEDNKLYATIYDYDYQQNYGRNIVPQLVDISLTNVEPSGSHYLTKLYEQYQALELFGTGDKLRNLVKITVYYAPNYFSITKLKANGQKSKSTIAWNHTNGMFPIQFFDNERDAVAAYNDGVKVMQEKYLKVSESYVKKAQDLDSLMII